MVGDHLMTLLQVPLFLCLCVFLFSALGEVVTHVLSFGVSLRLVLCICSVLFVAR